MSAILAAGIILLFGAVGITPQFLTPTWWFLILGAAMVSIAIGHFLTIRGKR